MDLCVGALVAIGCQCGGHVSHDWTVEALRLCNWGTCTLKRIVSV